MVLHSSLYHLRSSEELFNSGNYDEVYALLSDFEVNKANNLNEIITSQLFKTELLFQQGRYKEILILAETIKQECISLGKKLQRVNALIWIARALIFLNKLDEAYEVIVQGEKCLECLPDKTSFRYISSKAFLLFVKGYFYYVRGEVDQSLIYLNQSLSLRETLGCKHEISESLCWIAIILCKFKGELQNAKKYAKRCIVLAKESAKKFYIAFSYTSLAVVYTYQGNINKCIPLFEKSLAIFRELDNKRMIAITLNNTGEKYRMRGDLDLALTYLELSKAILLELDNLRDVASIYDFLIQILIEKENLDQAKIYLDNLEQLRSKLKDVEIKQIYFFLKALILKKSLRIRDKAKAEKIFNQLIEEKSTSYELSISILINSCELYLYELKATNNLEVLNDISPLILKLLNIAKKSKSYGILSETYLLQAKLFLLTFEIKKARKFLNQAQEIAESYGLKQLAIKISHEHDNLVHQLKIWQELKKSGSSLTERSDLAGLDQQIEFMLNRRMFSVPKLLEEKPVLLLIISKGGIPIFTQSFIKNKIFEEHLFGGFFAAFNSFMDKIFYEGLDRASFGEYTLLMKDLKSFLLCYIYKGQSYPAQNRIRIFIDELTKSKKAWETIEKFNNQNRIIQKDEIPSLDSMVSKVFIDKSIPSMNLG